MYRFWSLLGLFVVISTLLCCKSYVEVTEVVEELDQQIDSSQYYKVELGRHLFYDPILSRDTTISCAVCHKQDLAFTDGLPQSIGIKNRVGKRNAPTLTNVANRPYFLLDGVNPTLEAQVTAPIQEHAEFDFQIMLIVERLKGNPKYVEMAKRAYGGEITNHTVFNSIAEFERTMISNNSPFDQFVAGDQNALSPEAKRGRELFYTKLYCAKCHNGSDLTDDRLTNNGLYTQYADSGRMRMTHNVADIAIFKVPTLRNIAVTAPYMHDGSIETLEEVIRHYMSGGKDHPNKSEIIQPFELTDQGINDLIAFLNSLTDQSFLTNPSFSDPN